jgi:membrane protein implicated in regulation of membrane protease activity
LWLPLRSILLSLEYIGLALGVAFSLGGGEVWMGTACFAFALVVALWGWWRAFTRSRIISNTPAERIASATQGYSRLAGRGKLLGGSQIYLPGTGVPCLWYRITYRQVRRTRGFGFLFFSDSGFDSMDDDESDGSFLIDDGSGTACAVDPEGAEMRVGRYNSRRRGNILMERWYLMPGDRIEALGEFFTLGSIDVDLNTSRQIGELLESWKADRRELLRRFDQDGDGELSMQEWEAARAAARQEVERTQREALAEPEAHLMRKPKDGRPYLIADRSLDSYARQLWWWSIAHGLVFVLAAAALGWLYVHGGELREQGAAQSLKSIASP